MSRVLPKLLLAFTLLVIGTLVTSGCSNGDIDGTAATGSSGIKQGIGDASNVEPLPSPPKLEVPRDER